jgi:hypothetical protein
MNSINYKRMVVMLFLGFTLILKGGCAALLVGGAAGAGTVAYYYGELKATEEVSMRRAWSATQKAMTDLGYAITNKDKDAFYAELVARGAGDKKVKIRLESQTDTLTDIKIRVGTFGNESLSRRILDKIKKHYS